MPRNFCFDFDQTIVAGHFHSALGNKLLPSELDPEHDEPSATKPSQDPYNIRGATKALLEDPNTGIRNEEQLVSLFKKIIARGDKISIVSYSNYPTAVDETMRRIVGKIIPPNPVKDFEKRINAYIEKNFAIVVGFPKLSTEDNQALETIQDLNAQWKERRRLWAEKHGKKQHIDLANIEWGEKNVKFNKKPVFADDDTGNRKHAAENKYAEVIDVPKPPMDPSDPHQYLKAKDNGQYLKDCEKFITPSLFNRILNFLGYKSKNEIQKQKDNESESKVYGPQLVSPTTLPRLAGQRNIVTQTVVQQVFPTPFVAQPYAPPLPPLRNQVWQAIQSQNVNFINELIKLGGFDFFEGNALTKGAISGNIYLLEAMRMGNPYMIRAVQTALAAQCINNPELNNFVQGIAVVYTGQGKQYDANYLQYPVQHWYNNQLQSSVAFYNLNQKQYSITLPDGQSAFFNNVSDLITHLTNLNIAPTLSQTIAPTFVQIPQSLQQQYDPRTEIINQIKAGNLSAVINLLNDPNNPTNVLAPAALTNESLKSNAILTEALNTGNPHVISAVTAKMLAECGNDANKKQLVSNHINDYMLSIPGVQNLTRAEAELAVQVKGIFEVIVRPASIPAEGGSLWLSLTYLHPINNKPIHNKIIMEVNDNKIQYRFRNEDEEVVCQNISEISQYYINQAIMITKSNPNNSNITGEELITKFDGLNTKGNPSKQKIDDFIKLLDDPTLSKEAISELIKHDFGSGNFALIKAIEFRSPKLVECLIKHGADINAQPVNTEAIFNLPKDETLSNIVTNYSLSLAKKIGGAEIIDIIANRILQDIAEKKRLKEIPQELKDFMELYKKPETTPNDVKDFKLKSNSSTTLPSESLANRLAQAHGSLRSNGNSEHQEKTRVITARLVISGPIARQPQAKANDPNTTDEFIKLKEQLMKSTAIPENMGFYKDSFDATIKAFENGNFIKNSIQLCPTGEKV